MCVCVFRKIIRMYSFCKVLIKRTTWHEPMHAARLCKYSSLALGAGSCIVAQLCCLSEMWLCVRLFILIHAFTYVKDARTCTKYKTGLEWPPQGTCTPTQGRHAQCEDESSLRPQSVQSTGRSAWSEWQRGHCRTRNVIGHPCQSDGIIVSTAVVPQELGCARKERGGESIARALSARSEGMA
jgi:hypothetical protein